jgi:hypothetical protein
VSVNPSVDKIPIVSHDRVCAVMASILRAAKVKHYTDEQLEELSGIPARTIKSYRSEGKEPSLSAALSIGCALGGWALNSILAEIGYAARPLDEADELHAGQVVANGLRNFTVIANAAADGRFDHTEEQDCRKAADEIIATVLPLSSAGRAA